jgi:hypothetical protein
MTITRTIVKNRFNPGWPIMKYKDTIGTLSTRSIAVPNINAKGTAALA